MSRCDTVVSQPESITKRNDVKGDRGGEEGMAHSFHKNAIGHRFSCKRPVDWLGSRLATDSKENEIGRYGVCGRELRQNRTFIPVMHNSRSDPSLSPLYSVCVSFHFFLKERHEGTHHNECFFYRSCRTQCAILHTASQASVKRIL